MKQAIKVLQKRFDELKEHHKQTMQKFDKAEMFNDLKNIELEQIELTKAIIILNKYVK